MTDDRKFHVHHKEYLDSDERRKLLNPQAIVASLPLVADQTVGDVGCGTGFFTEPLARAVPKGRVLAFDVQQEMVEATRERISKAGLSNVEVRQSAELQLPVDDATFDGVFTAFILHETPSQTALAAELHRVAKPGAWLAVLEFHRIADTGGPPLQIRLTPAETSALLTGAGFKEIGKAIDLNDRQYIILARA
ncbi:MAG: class I SAM-dependent methyltransferase [Chloroflexota bacterium]